MSERQPITINKQTSFDITKIMTDGDGMYSVFWICVMICVVTLIVSITTYQIKELNYDPMVVECSTLTTNSSPDMYDLCGKYFETMEENNGKVD